MFRCYIFEIQTLVFFKSLSYESKLKLLGGGRKFKASLPPRPRSCLRVEAGWNVLKYLLLRVACAAKGARRHSARPSETQRG